MWLFQIDDGDLVARVDLFRFDFEANGYTLGRPHPGGPPLLTVIIVHLLTLALNLHHWHSTHKEMMKLAKLRVHWENAKHQGRQLNVRSTPTSRAMASGRAGLTIAEFDP